LHITGMIKSAPTDAVDTCTDLLPFHLLVKKLVCCATTRLAMFPQVHPLEKHASRAAGTYIKGTKPPCTRYYTPSESSWINSRRQPK